MKKIDLNKFAQQIAKREGLKIGVNIAQIKEILSRILEELAKHPQDEIEDVLSRYRIERE